jgi:hypothetical protein
MWWAQLLVALAGLVLCTGMITRFRDAAPVLALILFAVALALTLIPVVST